MRPSRSGLVGEELDCLLERVGGERGGRAGEEVLVRSREESLYHIGASYHNKAICRSRFETAARFPSLPLHFLKSAV